MAVCPATAPQQSYPVSLKVVGRCCALGSKTCVSCSLLARSPAFRTRRQAFKSSKAPASITAELSAHSASGSQGDQSTGQLDAIGVSNASVYQPASLSRVFIGVQPGRGVAKLTKGAKPSGPMSLVLLLFTVAGTISAAVRSRLETAARGCSTCHGYGINRCTLCSGTGAVGWEGKWNHKEPCPMCLGKRFIGCPECGGHFHRRIFNHHHHTGLTVTELVEAEQGPLAKMGD